MSLREVIRRHGATYQVIRQGDGVYTAKGRYTPAAEAAGVDIIAVIQPLQGRMLAALPEGQSAEDTRVVYTQFKLLTRGPGNAPDQISYNGDRWRVYQVMEWEGLSGSPHYVAYIVRQTSQEDPI